MSAIKKITFTLLFFSGFIIFSNQAKAQVPDEIIQSLKTGNSKTLSAYFNQNVELVVLENDNVYSKAQAQQIVNKFFSSNPPENFIIIHQGGKEGAQYVIGNLVTGKGTYRVYFLLKKSDGKDYIHQLRIESQ
jgi:hypothetical protein